MSEHNARVAFVGYDGEYPNLCAGTLVLTIDGEEVVFPEDSLHSKGSVRFGSGYGYASVHEGDWIVDVPDRYAHLRDEIEACVNDHVPHGCCGGCI